jgi:hypothetical protein
VNSSDTVVWEVLKQAPALGILVYLVVYFLRHLAALSAQHQDRIRDLSAEHEKRLEDVHEKTRTSLERATSTQDLLLQELGRRRSP